RGAPAAKHPAQRRAARRSRNADDGRQHDAMWRVDDAESILRREVVVVLGESAAGAERVRLSPLIVPAAAPGVVELTAPHLGRPLFQLDGNGAVLALAARGRLHLTDVLELRIRPQQLTGADGRTGHAR